MIVEPDFLTHWKTQMLVDDLNDKAAPLYVIALWAHCQNRKTDSFENLTHKALKAICRFDGDGETLQESLRRCGFLDMDGDKITVHGWAEINAKLFANWENGFKGGRPKKPTGNPPETQTKPTGNPPETHSKPIEKIEKREETELRVSEINAGAKTRRPTLAEAKAAASNIGITEALASEWWNCREASEWFKGMAGGGTSPVGINWQADLKTYVTRNCNAQSRYPAPTDHRAAKAAREFPEPPRKGPRNLLDP